MRTVWTVLLAAALLTLGAWLSMRSRPVPSASQTLAERPARESQRSAPAEETPAQPSRPDIPSAMTAESAAFRRGSSPFASRSARLARRQTAILEALQDNQDRNTRARALQALLQLPTRQGVRESLWVLSGLEIEEQRFLSESYLQTWRPELEQFLLEITAEDSSPEVRRLAAEILAERDDRRARSQR